MTSARKVEEAIAARVAELLRAHGPLTERQIEALVPVVAGARRNLLQPARRPASRAA
ncbi:MAG TPA: hypothetical protein VFC00_29045 [Micromonosporaceae bacterium]|nr:hypothetical protein [Micromonosporaceae bacterium]